MITIKIITYEKSVFLLALCIALHSCTRDELQNENPKIEVSQKDPLTGKQINERINQSIKTDGTFNWSNESDHFCGAQFFAETGWYLSDLDPLRTILTEVNLRKIRLWKAKFYP